MTWTEGFSFEKTVTRESMANFKSAAAATRTSVAACGLPDTDDEDTEKENKKGIVAQNSRRQ